MINGGSVNEYTDFAVAEVITWDAPLSADQMLSVTGYLRANILGWQHVELGGGGARKQAETVYTCANGHTP